MEFKSLKNIESSFRQIRLFGIVFLSLCAVITVWSVWSSYRFAERQREKIYVLDNGKSLMLALSQTCRRTSGRSEGTRAPFPRAVLHALTRKERDRA